MPCLESSLHRLKPNPPARANDQNCGHGVMLLVGPPGSRHVLYNQRRRKWAGALSRLNQSAEPRKPSRSATRVSSPGQVLALQAWGDRHATPRLGGSASRLGMKLASPRCSAARRIHPLVRPTLIAYVQTGQRSRGEPGCSRTEQPMCPPNGGSTRMMGGHDVRLVQT
jgi:hypothetical protein